MLCTKILFHSGFFCKINVCFPLLKYLLLFQYLTMRYNSKYPRVVGDLILMVSQVKEIQCFEVPTKENQITLYRDETIQIISDVLKMTT